MIDEYWTWQFYGYHSDELKPRSGKPVVARCDDCCQYRVLPKDGYRDLCIRCVMSGRKRLPFSDDWRQNMSESAKVKIFTNEHRHNMSIASGSRRHTDETRVKMSEVRTGHVCTDETRCKISASAKAYYSDPINIEKLSAARQGIPYDEWEGFATDKAYCPAFDETCRESNREKYDRQCFLCGKDESENITSSNKCRKLSVHHVDMNKQQGCDEHGWKLVPLCMHHHGKTHSDVWMNRIIYLLNTVWNKV